MMRSPSLSSSSSKPAAVGNSSGNATPCCSKVVGLRRGMWTAEEDQLLSDYIKKHGEGRWRTLPAKAGLLRCGKSCRLRWMNYLRPSVKRGQITADEEDLILRLHRLLGNRWSLIAGRIPGRTDNEIKNYWNTHLSKKLISQGIDPKTHKPLINPNQYPSINNNKNPSSKPTSNPNYAPLPSENVEDVPPKDSRRDGDDHDDTSYDDDMINNYCTDEAFSSFLNSLINDDMFNVNQLLQDDAQQHQPNNLIIGSASDDEPMVSCDQWDMSPSMACSANCTSEPKVPSDQGEDQ